MTIRVIGMGEDGPSGLLPLYKDWINNSERLAGGKRQLAYFPDYQGEKVVLERGLKQTIDSWGEESKETIVLASGDPLFFGIGAYLAKKRKDVSIHPALSSIQLAFARINESWQDAAFISVHGRKMDGLAQKVSGKKKVCLLTDEHNNPARIARYLLYFGMSEYKMCIGEQLGTKKEHVQWLSLEEAAGYQADSLNVVILKAEKPQTKPSIGIPDDMFIQRKPDKGLITKQEVRVLSLSALNVQKNSTVWDIGTCTGSVAIEAAHLCEQGQVYAIEKNEQDIAYAKENAARLRSDIHFYHGKAPDYLEEWPAPDAVFIGGTGGDMEELLLLCVKKLNPGGRIVLNAATIETLSTAKHLLHQLGCEVDITMTQLARSKPILHMTRFEGLNPVYIVTARPKERKT
ncbi:precorrin-6Y C5,15-methyltransferase (decarboxylating) [Alteribacillus persepolensis]|uniref:Precorrin-6Y C5,15-methyltransferase (Decarboxylating) n=1 Tax=Alteribacillus persepolensis TaxID=568899 RepID=A0A1G7Z555_9BACI|nr:precorrin-6y C5,15-methyltransferase (decarboxylating) subunit CbiE [Alteribacillus persepolensis]SDH03853.1 precorrin-6Y C5,15-methyltransferase (decarboxylating) [Alteribacillus persepolensis]